MIPCTYRQFTALVISLAVQVISLSGMAAAASAPNPVTVQKVISAGLKSPSRIVRNLEADGVNFYVTDSRSGGVLKLNRYGVVVKKIATVGTPFGVAVNTAGTVIAVSQGTFVSLYDQNGAEIRKLGAGIGEFQGADGVAIDPNGYIYVVDSRANALKMYNSTGVLQTTVTSWTPATGGYSSFSNPTGIAYDKSASGARIAVADTMHGQIQFFRISGTSLVYDSYTGRYGGYTAAGLQMTMPVGVTFDYTGGATPAVSRMYVTDMFQSSVQVIDISAAGIATPSNFTGKGTYLSYIGSYGSAAGKLMVPTDGVFDETNNQLVVANGFGNLTVYGIDNGVWPTDPTAPTLSITPPDPTTTSTPLAVTGSSNGTRVYFTKNGVSTDCTLNTGAVTCSVPLSYGSNTFTVTATNAGANTTTVGPYTVTYLRPAGFTVDSTPALINYFPMAVTGGCDAGATVTYDNATTSTSNAACVVTGTTWRCTVNPMFEGDNLLTFKQTATGVVSATISRTVTLDTTPPVLTLSAITGGSYTTQQVQNVSGTASDLHGVTVTVNGAAAGVNAKGVFSSPLVLSVGSTAMTVVATDGAGNSMTIERVLYFDTDLDRPVITIASPADNIVTNSSTITLSGTATSTDYSIKVGNTYQAVDAGGNWTTSQPLVLVAGLNTIEIVAVGPTGHSTSVKRSIYYDSTNPAVAVTSPAQDMVTKELAATISGTAPAAATMTRTFNGNTVAVPITGGTFTFDITFPATEGNYPLLLTVTNGGNTTTTVRNVIFDKTQPELIVDPDTSTHNVLYGTVDPLVTTVQVKSNLGASIGTVSLQNGNWIADLTGVTYSPYNTTVVAVDAAGNSTSHFLIGQLANGDMNVDGVLNTADALFCLRSVVGLITPTLEQIAHGDIWPLGSPDGIITLNDCGLILNGAVGLEVPYTKP